MNILASIKLAFLLYKTFHTGNVFANLSFAVKRYKKALYLQQLRGLQSYIFWHDSVVYSDLIYGIARFFSL
jgi:hypothetical protein